MDVEQVPIPPLGKFVRDNVRGYGIILTQEQRNALASRARTGDEQAVQEIIYSFLRFCANLAYSYSEMNDNRVGAEYEDLLQLAILQVVEVLPQALARYENPFPYIVVSVRREIVEHCQFRSHLIRVPETLKNGKSVHAPIAIDPIEKAVETETSISLIEETYEGTEKLYESVEQLQGRFKQVIEMRFGLNGHAPTSLPEISLAISGGKGNVKNNMAGTYQSMALKKLQAMLTS